MQNTGYFHLFINPSNERRIYKFILRSHDKPKRLQSSTLESQILVQIVFHEMTVKNVPS